MPLHRLDGDDGGALHLMLSSCGELTGAAGIALLIVDPAIPSSIGVHAASGSRMDVDAPAMRAAIRREAALMFPATGPSWEAEGEERAGATTFARVAAVGTSTYILALSFASASEGERTRIARLMPSLVALVAGHVQAASRLAALEDQYAACVLALDHGDCGIIAVRDDHTMLLVNAAAAAMLESGHGLHVKRGVVRPVDYRQAVRFEAALDTVQESGGTKEAMVMLLPGEGDARPLIVTVVPARATRASTRGASALIYLFQPDIHSVHGLDTVASLHGLSGVERRLLAQLCAGLTVAESAERLRIKLETARAYLKQIFAKTGTHRQTELVALMTRYLRAMRGDFDFRVA